MLEIDKQEESDGELSVDLQVNFDFSQSPSPEVAKIASCFPPTPESPNSSCTSSNSTHCAAGAIGMMTQRFEEEEDQKLPGKKWQHRNIPSNVVVKTESLSPFADVTNSNPAVVEPSTVKKRSSSRRYKIPSPDYCPQEIATQVSRSFESMDQEYAYHPNDRRAHGPVCREEYRPLAQYVEYIPEGYRYPPQRRPEPHRSMLRPMEVSSYQPQREYYPREYVQLPPPPRQYHEQVRPMEARSNQFHQVQPMEVPSNHYLRPEEVRSAFVLPTPQGALRVSYSGNHDYECDEYVIRRPRQGYFRPNQA